MKKQTNKIKLFATVVVVGLMFITIGCGKNEPTASEAGENTGDALKTASDKTGDALETAGDKTVETTGKAIDKTGETLKDAGTAVENTGENMQK